MNEMAKSSQMVPHQKWDSRPRIMLGGWMVATLNQSAIVIDPIDRTVRGIRGLQNLRPAEYRFMATLLLNFGKHVTYEEIFEGIWGNPKDGGPDYAKSIISAYTWSARQKIAGSGLAISNWYRVGLMIGLEHHLPPIRHGRYYPKKAIRS